MLKKFILCLLLLSFGCSKDGEFKSNIKADIGSEFLSKSADINNNATRDKWWEEFNDEFLNEIIELGLKNNKDIQLANISIITARQLNNIDATALIPTGKIGIERQRFASPAFGPNGVRYDLYQATLDASWELDFFGKNLNRYKASKLRFLQDLQLYKASSIRVASEIAQNYILLKAKQKQIENLEEIAEIRGSLNKINNKKQAQGVVLKTQVYLSEIEHSRASSNLIAAKTEEKIITYRLAVLLGMTPEKFLDLLKDPRNKKQISDYNAGIVPLGLKSDILKRRPDIIAAEYEIDAALYEKSAQFKEFFPSFNLTARVGGASKNIGDVFKDGANVKDIRGGFSLPIFAIPQLLAEYKISKAKAKSAVINYEKTVLEAIADCESGLARYIDAIEVEQNAFVAKSNSDKIFKITKNKRLIGAASSEDLHQSRITNLDSEIFLLQKKAESLSQLIALHKAIGGGFEGYQMKFENDQVQFVENSK